MNNTSAPSRTESPKKDTTGHFIFGSLIFQKRWNAYPKILLSKSQPLNPKLYTTEQYPQRKNKLSTICVQNTIWLSTIMLPVQPKTHLSARQATNTSRNSKNMRGTKKRNVMKSWIPASNSNITAIYSLRGYQNSATCATDTSKQ